MSKGAPKAESEFVALSDGALRAVSGPSSRHAALIEDAFSVLIETPGGGVSIRGHGRDRARAREVVEALAERIAARDAVTEADVRVAINTARAGDFPKGPGAKTPAVKRGGGIGPRTAAQAVYLDLLARYDLVFGIGPAGTGKTFLAVAHGAGLLMRGEVDRLIVTRPAVEAGEKLGYLPGDLYEKVDPYMAPVMEALTDIMGADQLRRRRDKGEIEVAPIAFMRGRTLAHAYVIVDEAQNASRLQMKMVLTRLGEGARMVVTGDPSQIDLLNPNDSGLGHALRILEGVEGMAVAKFEAKDVVRHPMVERIVRAYDKDSAPYMIEVVTDDPAWETALPEAQALAVKAAQAVSPGSDIAILLTSDEAVRAMNDQFRAIDKPTNVLSFPASGLPGEHLGDIALAFGVCSREAAEQGKSLAAHLQHLVAHGALHLVGYDHEDDADAQAMEAREREILAGLGVADPYV